MPETKPLLASHEAGEAHPGAEYRLAGDRYIQVRASTDLLPSFILHARVHAGSGPVMAHAHSPNKPKD